MDTLVRTAFLTTLLRNEVEWLDEGENSGDNLSMRLANIATFVRATFSNRLSIFIEDSAAVIVVALFGMLLQTAIACMALVALGTLPILVISTTAQKLWLAGFSKGIQEMHRKASLVLEDAVKNIYTVVAFCAGNKVMELYRLHLRKILSFLNILQPLQSWEEMNYVTALFSFGDHPIQHYDATFSPDAKMVLEQSRQLNG